MAKCRCMPLLFLFNSLNHSDDDGDLLLCHLLNQCLSKWFILITLCPIFTTLVICWISVESVNYVLMSMNHSNYNHDCSCHLPSQCLIQWIILILILNSDSLLLTYVWLSESFQSWWTQNSVQTWNLTPPPFFFSSEFILIRQRFIKVFQCSSFSFSESVNSFSQFLCIRWVSKFNESALLVYLECTVHSAGRNKLY